MGTERIQSYLFDTWQAGDGSGTDLVNPATEEVLATASSAGLDLAGALAHARNVGGPALRAMTFEERGALLQRMSSALHALREPLIDSAVANGGCTRSDAKFDIDGAIFSFSAYAEVAKGLGANKILADGEGIQLGRSPRFWGQHVFVPRRGVAVLINAFNFPTWGFAEKAACAVLAGMPAFIKPATATALTAYKATQAIIEQADAPAGVLSFLGGSPGDLLEHLDGQDVLAFTGGAATGAKLRAMPAVTEGGVRVNVEADSLNAAVLGPDLSMGDDGMDLFLREVAKEMTQKAGQKCTAVRRIFVPEAMVDTVIEALVDRLKEVRIGNPAEKDTRMGPLTTKQQLADVHAGIDLLRKDAELVFGDPAQPVTGSGGKGYFCPIMLLKAKDSAKADHVHSHEVFGPVATVLPYDGSAEQAAELVRMGGGGLVASVFSDDRSFMEDVTLGVASHHGRVYLGSSKVLEYATGHGLVFPSCVHGGPGRAGGGEELGGVRGVERFMQRTVIQGPRAMVQTISGTK